MYQSNLMFNVDVIVLWQSKKYTILEPEVKVEFQYQVYVVIFIRNLTLRLS